MPQWSKTFPEGVPWQTDICYSEQGFFLPPVPCPLMISCILADVCVRGSIAIEWFASLRFFSIVKISRFLIGHKELSSETRRAKSPATDGVFPAEPWSHHHRVSLGIHEKEEETEGSSLSSLRKKKPWKTVRKYSEENNCMVLESILITNSPHICVYKYELSMVIYFFTDKFYTFLNILHLIIFVLARSSWRE